MSFLLFLSPFCASRTFSFRARVRRTDRHKPSSIDDDASRTTVISKEANGDTVVDVTFTRKKMSSSSSSAPSDNEIGMTGTLVANNDPKSCVLLYDSKKKQYVIERIAGVGRNMKPRVSSKTTSAVSKRTREDAAERIAKKKAKTTPSKEYEVEGWCSDPSRALTREQESRVVRGSTDGCVKLSEKSLVGKGRREIVRLDATYLVEFAGVRNAKYVGKDKDRFEAMCDAADRKFGNKHVRVVLLKHDGNICRRRTLTHFNEVGVVVQRAHST